MIFSSLLEIKECAISNVAEPIARFGSRSAQRVGHSSRSHGSAVEVERGIAGAARGMNERGAPVDDRLRQRDARLCDPSSGTVPWEADRLGAKSRIDISGIDSYNLVLAGCEWRFGQWLDQEVDWCRAAYEYASGFSEISP
jgi:hypothetical protein